MYATPWHQSGCPALHCLAPAALAGGPSTPTQQRAPARLLRGRRIAIAVDHDGSAHRAVHYASKVGCKLACKAGPPADRPADSQAARCMAFPKPAVRAAPYNAPSPLSGGPLHPLLLQLLIKSPEDKVEIVHVQQRDRPCNGAASPATTYARPASAGAPAEAMQRGESEPWAELAPTGGGGGGAGPKRDWLSRLSLQAMPWQHRTGGSSGRRGARSASPAGRSSQPESDEEEGGCRELLERCRQQLLASNRRQERGQAWKPRAAASQWCLPASYPYVAGHCSAGTSSGSNPFVPTASAALQLSSLATLSRACIFDACCICALATRCRVPPERVAVRLLPAGKIPEKAIAKLCKASRRKQLLLHRSSPAVRSGLKVPRQLRTLAPGRKDVFLAGPTLLVRRQAGASPAPC